MRYSVTRPHIIRIPIFGCGCGYAQESKCSTHYIPHTTLDSFNLIPTLLLFPMPFAQYGSPVCCFPVCCSPLCCSPPCCTQYAASHIVANPDAVPILSNYAVPTMLFPIMLLSLCCLPPCSSPLFCCPVLLPTMFRLNMLVSNMLLVIMQVSLLLLSVIRHASIVLCLGRFSRTPPLDNKYRFFRNKFPL